ncbi:MAG: P-loop NTPase [Planctomycetota bacterium]
MSQNPESLTDKIQSVLRQFQLPGTKQDLVSAGAVNRVIARDGKVSVILSFPASVAGARDALKREIEAKLRTVPGVDSVQMLEKAAPSASPGDPRTTTGQGAGNAVGGQGVPGVKHIVAVASGKGGVGKSTIAVNLAAQLARLGQRTGLLDSDVYGPSIPKMLGLEGAQPRVTPDERLLPITAHGLKTMSIGFMLDDESPVIWRGPMVTSLLRQFLFQVEWGDLDFLVLDLPPGTGDAQLTIVQTVSLSCGLIVTTPQDVALLDVQRGIQMFQRVNVPIFGIVENMSVFVCPHCNKETAIFSSGGGAGAAKRYEVPFLGSVPLVAAYVKAGDAGKPMAIQDPKSALAKVMLDAAQRLIEQYP